MPRLEPPTLSPAGIDVLKLAACLLMLLDHLNAVLLARGEPGLFLLGRPVFPLFALIAATHYLYHTRDAGRYLRRLLLAAVIVQPLYWLSFSGTGQSPLVLNILFTLGLGLLLLHAFDEASARGRPLAALALLAVLLPPSLLVEYGPVGMLLVPVAAVWLRTPGGGTLALLAATLAVLNLPALLPAAVPATLLALPLFLAAARIPGDRLPLPGWFFYLFYPAHLLALYGMSRLLSA